MNSLQEAFAAGTADFLIKQPISLTLNHTPFLNALSKYKRIERMYFAPKYKLYLNGQYGPADYLKPNGDIDTKYDVEPLSPNFRIATIASLVTFDRKLVDFASSPNILVDHINVKFSEAAGAMLSTVDGKLSSKGDEAKEEILGLENAVSKKPAEGTYAGIDRAKYKSWRNIAVEANKAATGDLSKAVFDGKATDINNILARLNAVISLLDYNGGFFNNRIILASPDWYQLISDAITKTGRNVMTDRDTLYFGANNLNIRGIPIINAGGIKYINAGGIAKSTLYILNLDTFKLGYINNQVSYLKQVIKQSKSYKANDINLDSGLMFFNLPGIDKGDQWWQKQAVNNANYCAQLFMDIVFTCIDPSKNLVMFDGEAATPPASNK